MVLYNDAGKFLTELTLSHHSTGPNISIAGISRFSNLRTLYIDTEAIADLVENAHCIEFPCLNSITLEENVNLATFFTIKKGCPALQEFHDILIDGNEFCSACEDFLDDNDTISFHPITSLTIHFAHVNLIDLAVFADGLHRSFPNIETLNLKFDLARDRVVPTFGKDPANLKRIFEILDHRCSDLEEVFVACEWLSFDGPYYRLLGGPVMDSFSGDNGEMNVCITD
ncbi:hypothetical protein HDU76_011756 [Blyttiomyces sp. JEL0837]|nr:hypothetical protein HDU76_011756 [Blyttiomyces sp. JEL0837]